MRHTARHARSRRPLRGATDRRLRNCRSQDTRPPRRPWRSWCGGRLDQTRSRLPGVHSVPFRRPWRMHLVSAACRRFGSWRRHPRSRHHLLEGGLRQPKRRRAPTPMHGERAGASRIVRGVPSFISLGGWEPGSWARGDDRPGRGSPRWLATWQGFTDGTLLTPRWATASPGVVQPVAMVVFDCCLLGIVATGPGAGSVSSAADNLRSAGRHPLANPRCARAYDWLVAAG